MKKRTLTQLLTVLLLTAATIGCSQDHGHDTAKETIVLDNGTKWTVHDNMMIHIEQMSTDVKATAADMDYDGLNKRLLTGIDALTSDCTMKGQAHDELHKWLLPFIGTANEFSLDMTADQKKGWFVKVQDSMAEFNTYFK